MFLTALATLLIVYVIYAVTKGEVRGLSRLVDREASPDAFWRLITLYGLIGIILLAVA